MKMKRSIYCGAVREADIGSEHTACGWVQTKRDMGGVIFLDLRDREGILQVVCNAMYLAAEAFHTAEGLKNESVIAVRGKIRLRDEETVNRKIETGTIELLAEEIEVLSAAGPLPYHLVRHGSAGGSALSLSFFGYQAAANTEQSEISAYRTGGCGTISRSKWIYSGGNADSDKKHAGRSPGLFGSEQSSSWNLLRTASVAPDLQAASDGGRY